VEDEMPKVKLTETEVIEIREKYATFEFTQRELAEEYGVIQQSINQIVCGTTWKHVGGPITKMGQGGHGAYKLAHDQIREIKKEYATGKTTMKKLAKEYGVSPGTILNAICWRDVWDEKS
jgi:DNA-binding XRE family transcriptional regulator